MISHLVDLPNYSLAIRHILHLIVFLLFSNCFMHMSYAFKRLQKSVHGRGPHLKLLRQQKGETHRKGITCNGLGSRFRNHCIVQHLAMSL